MVEIDQLTKVYGNFRAVDSLSLRLNAGEILGLVGPNGAGKTTTLRCMAGIIPPTEGRIRLDGYDLFDDPVEYRARLAFVPDEPHLFEHLTVWDHLMLFGRLYRVAETELRAEQLLQENDLIDRKYAFPGELSRGMKQKLIISCALLHDPGLLVLDEPLTGLDPGAMRRTKSTIVETARAGAAVLVSSHMLHLVEEICGRIVLIHKGRKALEGTLDEIRAGLPDLDTDAGLEAIFLRAVEERESR